MRASRLEAAHHQVLEDALLDLVEAVVVLVEHRARVLEVEVVLGEHRPRHVAQPLEVGARDGVLGGLRRDARAGAPARGRPPCAPRAACSAFSMLRLELLDLALAVVALAQLLADRLQLLAQQELLLVLVERLRTDSWICAPTSSTCSSRPRMLGEQAQALLHVERLEQLLLVLGRQLEQRGDEVGDLARAGLVARGAPPPRRGWSGDSATTRSNCSSTFLTSASVSTSSSLGLGQALEARLEVGLVGRPAGGAARARRPAPARSSGRRGSAPCAARCRACRSRAGRASRGPRRRRPSAPAPRSCGRRP